MKIELLHGETCSAILQGFYSVGNALPFGLEKHFYKNALIIELQTLGLTVEENKKQEIIYKQKNIGELTLDLVVNNLVLLKLDNQKEQLETEQIEISKNYLKLTDFEVLLFLNFGLEIEHKRLYLTNDFKKRQ